MAGNGVPEKGKFNGVTGDAGGSAKGVLLVLLALAICSGYFYFFTDILRSKEETPTQPEVYTNEVKKPLPERLAEHATITEKATVPIAPPAVSPPGESPAVSPQQASKEPKVAANTEMKKVSAPPASTAKIPQKAVPTVDKKAVLPPQARTSQSASKPAVAPPREVKAAAKPSPVPEKTKEVKAVAKQAPTPAKLKNVAAKPVPFPVKETLTSPAEMKKLTTKSRSTVKKSAAKDSGSRQRPVDAGMDVAMKHEKAQPGVELTAHQKEGGKYTLVVGSYVLKSSMLAEKAKLVRAGLNPSVAAGKKRSEPMNRLMVAEFASYSSAHSELSRVKKASKDAFILQEKGRFTVYAGSYFRHERALEVQDRLRGQGFVPILKKSVAPVSTYTLTSGSFPTREAAEKEAARLRKLGFNPFPLQLKKQ